MAANTTESRASARPPTLSGPGVTRWTARFRCDPWRLAGMLIILVIVPWPIWLLLFQGLTITGYAEESTGYRYFHTLRLLYGDHERPLLPQGHLIGLVHMGIQIALTALGHPPSELFPRADIWAYTAVILPILAAVVAYVWAVQPLSGPGRLAVAVLLLVSIYQERVSTFWHLLQPDYYAWVHSLGLVALGSLLRVAWRTEPVHLRDVVLAGVFAGACLAVKPTWATFPMAVTLLLLVRTMLPLSVRNVMRAIRFGLLACVVAVVVVFLVLLLYHQMDIGAVRDHLAQQGRFMGLASMSMPFLTWFTPQAWEQQDILALLVFMPALLLVSALLLPGRLISLSLLPGALVAIYVSYQRAYTPTYVESASYTFVTLTVWSATVALPFVQRFAIWCRATPRAARLAAGFVGCLGMAAVLWTPPYSALVGNLRPLSASMVVSTALSQRIEHFMHETPGKTAVFILDNSHRPSTIHTGLAKAGGGLDVFDMTWGVSPLMDRIFPDQAYFFDEIKNSPVDLSKFDRMIFGSAGTPEQSPMEAIPSTRKRLYEVYGIAMIGFHCDVLQDTSPYSFLPSTAIVGCERWPDRHWPVRPGQIATLLPTLAMTEPNAVTLDRQGRQQRVEPGDIVYTLVPNGIWRMENDGSFVRLIAAPGSRITIANLGPWNEDRKRLAGLDVIAEEGGRWQFEPLDARPVNRASHFEVPDPNQLGPGWSITPGGDAFAVERLSDETGPFVRVRALKDVPYLLVAGNSALTGLSGVPVTTRGQIRTAPGRLVAMVLQDYGANDPRTVYFDRQKSTGEWQLLAIRTVTTRGRSEKDTYELGVTDMRAGDWFDVREFSVFLGRFPDSDTPRRSPDITPPAR